MGHHHGSQHGHGSHEREHGHDRVAHEPRAHVFWTRRRLALVAAIAILALGAFIVLTACERAPAPKPPAPPEKPKAAASAPAPAAGAAGVAAGAGGSQAGGYPVSGPEGDQTVIEVGGLRMPKPVTWVWTQPSMQFRALQYAVPAIGANAPAAELVFSVFPAGDGGPVGANLDRWANQFRAGEQAAPSLRSEVTVAGMKVSRIESTGDYMGMGAAAPRPGYMQLGAIVEAPGRNVFIKLVGPKATVESNRAAFEAMLAGAK